MRNVRAIRARRREVQGAIPTALAEGRVTRAEHLALQVELRVLNWIAGLAEDPATIIPKRRGDRPPPRGPVDVAPLLPEPAPPVADPAEPPPDPPNNVPPPRAARDRTGFPRGRRV